MFCLCVPFCVITEIFTGTHKSQSQRVAGAVKYGHGHGAGRTQGCHGGGHGWARTRSGWRCGVVALHAPVITIPSMATGMLVIEGNAFANALRRICRVVEMHVRSGAPSDQWRRAVARRDKSPCTSNCEWMIKPARPLVRPPQRGLADSCSHSQKRFLVAFGGHRRGCGALRAARFRCCTASSTRRA